MKKLQSGFTLIELMIVVAIVAILAAVAIPAYHDYMVRSRITECEAALGACKTSVSEYYDTYSDWPPDQTASGCTDQTTANCSYVTVATNGVLTVTPDSTNIPEAQNCTLTFTPTVTDYHITGWTGTVANYGDCAQYVSAVFRHAAP